MKKHKPLKNIEKESYATQSKIGQNAFVQSNDFEQAIILMADTIADMDIEKKQKDSKIELLEEKK